MSKEIVVRGLRLGSGRPKICVPIMAADTQALTEQIAAAKAAGAELLEWRADHCPGESADIEQFAGLRAAAGTTPLLFTFRTKQEGGEHNLSRECYLERLGEAAVSRCFDLIDVELLTCGDTVAKTIADIQRCGAYVIASSHDFTRTPPVETMFARLQAMRNAGADIPKLAVMPHSRADVLALLRVTEQFSREADCPVITMAMGAMGRISRIAGESFGSALTFGAVGRSSAPGQLDIASLRTVLEILHENHA